MIKCQRCWLMTPRRYGYPFFSFFVRAISEGSTTSNGRYKVDVGKRINCWPVSLSNTGQVIRPIIMTDH